MFISDQEFISRVTSEDNLVTRRKGASGSHETSADHLPISPDLDLPSLLDTIPSDSGQEKSTKGERGNKTFDPTKEFRSLDKLLTGYAGRGTKQLHRDTQAGIGVTASILGTTKAHRMGDVAISSAHSYERGYTNPVDLVRKDRNPKEDLLNKVIEGHGIVVDKCFNRLLMTLDLMDDGKLQTVKNPLQLSIIAKNLSGVIAHASNSTKENVLDAREQTVHFHILRPEMAQEQEYPTIEISSEPKDPQDPS